MTAMIWLASPAFAHKPSDSYLRLQRAATSLTLEWDIALKDLELLVGLDSNQDGNITWGEVREQQKAIVEHALGRLEVQADAQTCSLRLQDMLVTRHSDGAYVVLQFQPLEVAPQATIRIYYRLLFDVDPTHRGLVWYQDEAGTGTYVLSPDATTCEIVPGGRGLWRSFLDTVGIGVWHIWIGFDHILFLLTLLFPAVLIYRDQKWEPMDAFPAALRAVMKVVTVFTIAHSITLWLAVMEYVSLPSKWVEATIAFSIIITAIHNLRPYLPVSTWVVAFCFGLIHGFGFANVLLDLGLTNMALAMSLLGFNLGVELGQLAIVIAFLPVAFWLRRSQFYQTGVVRVGSAIIAVIATFWLIERVFEVKILGF